jgi:hypothetical protein
MDHERLRHDCTRTPRTRYAPALTDLLTITKAYVRSLETSFAAETNTRPLGQARKIPR